MHLQHEREDMMKKLIILSAALMIAIPGQALPEEKSAFRVYMDDRTTENFLRAFSEYESMREDTTDFGAAVVLAYMSLIELEKNLDILEENADDLSNGNKFSYANILLELGRYDDSIEIYEQLNEKTPKWSCPWRHKGEAQWKKGDLEEAVESLNMAIETRETHYDAYVMLAEVRRDMKEYEKALAVLEKGLTYYGKDIEDPEEEVGSLDVHFLHLDLLEKCGRTKEHDELREKMRKIAPGDERLN
jgi:tetratricopeptide (TPR) repeat protein